MSKYNIRKAALVCAGVLGVATTGLFIHNLIQLNLRGKREYIELLNDACKILNAHDEGAAIDDQLRTNVAFRAMTVLEQAKKQ